MSLNDRITFDGDWRDGMNAFRLAVEQRITALEEKLDMIMTRINWLEDPPKPPHKPIKQEEELKL